MTDRPILFSAPMVRALLDGQKTQTRRIIKPQPPENVTSAGVYSNSRKGVLDQWSWLSGDPRDIDTWGFEGDFKTRFLWDDRLWVKERCFIPPAHISERDMREGADTWPKVIYAADDLEGGRDMVERCNWRHRVSIHMPRWASRLTLIVTDVRVQRLQDISEEDAIAEGIPDDLVDQAEHACSAGHPRNPMVLAYSYLWDSINSEPGKRWADNPWIVAVTFTVEQRNIDRVGA